MERKMLIMNNGNADLFFSFIYSLQLLRTDTKQQ